MAAIEGQVRKGGVAIICGTGGLPGTAEVLGESAVSTPWGSALVKRLRIGGREVYGLLRHGASHTVAPHLVNYRANIAALAGLGVENVLALNACGGLSDSISTGDAVVVDQFLDFTRSRASTFFDGVEDGVVHTDVTAPYCPRLRRLLRDECARAGLRLHSSGVYVGCEGPRYESAAEVRMFRMLGGDVIGMTGLPEVVLAREAGLCYAALCVVANPAAGLGHQERVTHAEVEQKMAEVRPLVSAALSGAVARARDDPSCACRA